MLELLQSSSPIPSAVLMVKQSGTPGMFAPTVVPNTSLLMEFIASAKWCEIIHFKNFILGVIVGVIPRNAL